MIWCYSIVQMPGVTQRKPGVPHTGPLTPQGPNIAHDIRELLQTAGLKEKVTQSQKQLYVAHLEDMPEALLGTIGGLWKAIPFKSRRCSWPS